MKPSQAFQNRYSAARRWRDAERPYIEEIYSFCCPGREYDFSRSPKQPQSDDTEKLIDLPEELARDLAGDLVSYFTPSEAKWFEHEVYLTRELADYQDDIAALVDEREDEILDLIRHSNYNDIAPQWGFEASTHGTPALWVEAGHLTSPLHVSVVPPNELLVTPGYRGILDRFREVVVQADTVPNLLAEFGPNLSEPQVADKIRKPGAHVTVCWGFWLDWTDRANPQWQMEITVDGHSVASGLLGPYDGSCPLLVGRFNPLPGRPWGRGAGRSALPSMRVTDKLAENVLAAQDLSLSNTIIYPHDGVLDFSEGLIHGRAYPAGRGFDASQVADLSRTANVEQAWFSEERQDERLRRLFYQDGPRQRGDTPPTLGQWLDEARRIQKRLGKPSAPLWTELIMPFLKRVERIGVEIGRFSESVEFNGQRINLVPISPLQKAQNHDKVNVARSNLELGAAVLGETLPEVIDGAATWRNIIKASGDELTVIREESDAPQAPV